MTDLFPTWSDKDRVRMASLGIAVDEADRQLALFRRGGSPLHLVRPCQVGDGIVVIPERERPPLLQRFDEGRQTRRLMKFVPASGGATRMFQEWYRFLEGEGFTDTLQSRFLVELKRYAFFPDLSEALEAKGVDLQTLIATGNAAAVLDGILTEKGLGYGHLPKALLKFHATPEGGRTALEEHLVEAALYARDGQNVSRLHCTLSPEHLEAVRRLLERLQRLYEERWETCFEVGLSTQDPATNTLAVDLDGRPFRDEAGELVFRPGGHGALLTNLNGLEADIVFVKNIDNCVPDRLKLETVFWKRILAGYLIGLQEEIFAALRLLSKGDSATETEVERIAAFGQERLNLSYPEGFARASLSERSRILRRMLHRPIRVCGMVRNEGEPGGGPFWVEDPDGEGGKTLQIVEATQIDRESAAQRHIWESSTHFNPVDLVCGIRDEQGRKYNLEAFVDPAMALIARKSHKGRPLLALERPGLWNGGMAFWNTVFIEVPLATFNPVKNVSDLLRPQHLPE